MNFSGFNSKSKERCLLECVICSYYFLESLYKKIKPEIGFILGLDYSGKFSGLKIQNAMLAKIIPVRNPIRNKPRESNRVRLFFIMLSPLQL